MARRGKEVCSGTLLPGLRDSLVCPGNLEQRHRWRVVYLSAVSQRLRSEAHKTTLLYPSMPSCGWYESPVAQTQTGEREGESLRCGEVRTRPGSTSLEPRKSDTDSWTTGPTISDDDEGILRPFRCAPDLREGKSTSQMHARATL